MKNRLKLIRNHFHLSQEEFGNKINIKSRSHISSLESGNKNITDRIISDICREFNVNETWLRTGEGEMFEEVSSEEELAKYIGELVQTDDQVKKDLILTILKLDDDDWKVIKKIINGLKKD